MHPPFHYTQGFIAGALRRARAAGAAIACLLACAAPLHGLAPDRYLHQYNCQVWRRSSGLPANAVFAITQTSDGHLWLGTSQGLVRFDGIAFRTVTAPEVEGRIFVTLAPRSAGGLWYGLERGGVGYFDRGKFHPLPAGTAGGEFATVHHVRETRERALLIGSATAASLWRGDLATPPERLVTGVDTRDIFEDARGRLWFATSNGGILYRDEAGMHELPDAPGTSRREHVYSSVAVDGTGHVWLGTSEGLRCFAPDLTPRMDAPTTASEPRVFHIDRHGALWAGTVSEGILRVIDGRVERLGRIQGLASDRVLALAETTDGSIWVGTEDGLCQLSDVKFPLHSEPDGMFSAVCLAVAAAPDGTLVAGTADGLVVQRDGRFRTYGAGGSDGFRSRWTKGVFVARDGDVWMIGGKKTLSRFREDRVIRTWTPDTWPCAVAEDSRGIIVGLGDAVMRIEGDELVPLRLADGTPARADWIHALHVDRDDALWIASETGVARIRDGVLTAWGPEPGFGDRMCLALREGPDGAIWVIRNTGLLRIKDDRLATIDQEQGLHAEFVYAMVPDLHGSMWFDSPRGIFRVRQSELDAVADGRAARLTCEVFDGQHAVQTNDKAAPEYSGCRTGDGRIWFPTSKGLVSIDPAHVPYNNRAPSTFVEQLVVDGRTHTADTEPALAPGARTVQIDYAALEYSAPDRITYRYRLEGFDTGWHEAGARRSAFYTNLPPGRYAFHVTAANADGVWDTTGAVMRFVLRPHLFETTGFRIVLGVAGAGIVVILVALRDRRRRRAAEAQQRREQEVNREINARLERRVLERTAELQAVNRELEAFSYSVSHDLRQPLRGIDGWSCAVLDDYGPSLDTTARGYLERVRAESQRMGQLIDDLLRLARTSRAELQPVEIDLSALVTSTARHVAANRADTRTTLVVQPGLKAFADPGLMEAALFNLLDNAWKFSARAEQPRVEFGRRDTPRGPAFFLRDNGAGFDMRHARRLFGMFQRAHSPGEYPGSGIGLATVQRILTRHGGHVWADSAPGLGSTFFFQLPGMAPSTP